MVTVGFMEGQVTQTFLISSWPHLQWQQWQQWQRSDCREPTLFPVRVAPPPPAAPSFYIYSLEAVAGVYISAAAVSGAVSFPGGATAAAAHVAPSLLRSHQVSPTAPGRRLSAGDQRAGSSSETSCVDLRDGSGCCVVDFSVDILTQVELGWVRANMSARSAAQMTENSVSCSVEAAALHSS